MGRGTRGVLGYWEDFYGHMRYSLNLTTAPLSYSSNLPKVLKRLLFSTLRDKSVIILKQIRPLENVVKLPLWSVARLACRHGNRSSTTWKKGTQEKRELKKRKRKEKSASNERRVWGGGEKEKEKRKYNLSVLQDEEDKREKKNQKNYSKWDEK